MKVFFQLIAFVLIYVSVSAKETFLLPVKIESKWGCLNQDAELVIQPEYDTIATLEYNPNYVKVCKNNLWGIVDAKSNVLLPIKYISVYSLTHQIVTFRNKNYRGVGLLHLGTSQFIPACFNLFSYHNGQIRLDYAVSDTTVFDFDRVVYASCDTANVVLVKDRTSFIPLKYKPVHRFNDNNIIIKSDDKFGMWNLIADTISLPLEYDLIKGHFLHKGKQWWFVDSVFNTVYSYEQYDNVLDTYESFVIVKKGEMQGLFDRHSKKEIIPLDKQVLTFNKDMYNRILTEGVFVERNGHKGYFRIDGTELFPCIYTDVKFGSLALFRLQGENWYGIARKDGNIFFECSFPYSQVHAFYDLRFNERNFYISTPEKFYWYKFTEDEEYSLYYEENLKYKLDFSDQYNDICIYNSNTGIHTVVEEAERPYKSVSMLNYADSLRYVKFPGNYKCEKNNSELYICIKPLSEKQIQRKSFASNYAKLKKVHYFKDTLVNILHKRTNPEITNIDTIMPELWYKTNNNYASAWFNHHNNQGTAYALGVGSVQKGEIVPPNNKLLMYKDFEEVNCARVMSSEYSFSLINNEPEIIRKNLTYIDAPKDDFFRFAESGQLKCVQSDTFKIWIPYHRVWKTNNYSALTVVGGKWGFLDKDGNDAFTERYEYLSESIDNYSRVFKNGKWGVISISPHKITVPTKYEFVDWIMYKTYRKKINQIPSRFKEYNSYLFDTICSQFVKVKQGDKWGVCFNSTGKEIIAPIYSDVKCFYNGEHTLLALKDDAGWWLFNENGDKIVETPFYAVVNMKTPDAIRAYTHEGEIAVYATSGKVIVEPHFYSKIYYHNGFLRIEENNSMSYKTLDGQWFYR